MRIEPLPSSSKARRAKRLTEISEIDLETRAQHASQCGSHLRPKIIGGYAFWRDTLKNCKLAEGLLKSRPRLRSALEGADG